MNSLTLIKYCQLMRLHRPLPILLLLAPVYTALLLGEPQAFSIKIFLIFTLGGIIMRTAGCIVNDLADHKIDQQVSRTKIRPLANQSIGLKQAASLLLGLLFAALALVLMLNQKTLIWALISLGCSFFYPLTKRFFFIPQLILGLTYNMGVIMACTALNQNLSPSVFYLYLGSVLWTIAYDTFYALCDLVDDRRLGINSSALFFGGFVYPAIACCQFGTIILWCLMGYTAHGGYLFYFAQGACILSFIYQFYISQTKKEHLRAFNLNIWVGLFLLLGTKSITI